MLSSKKAYFSIREVCTRTELEPHVLRYWENEFPLLRPKKNRAGNRVYREKDIEKILHIKHLLYTEKFTITGAKKKLSFAKESNYETHDTNQQEKPTENSMIKEDLITELKEILHLLGH